MNHNYTFFLIEVPDIKIIHFRDIGSLFSDRDIGLSVQTNIFTSLIDLSANLMHIMHSVVRLSLLSFHFVFQTLGHFITYPR